ncbi:MAG: cytochrome c biogenesis protein/redoxin [Romboutsia sp.]
MEKINLIMVFIEGLLSFFSPCILPILPIYISILSNSNSATLENGQSYKGDLLKNTIFFVLGISTTFLILGSSIGALSDIIKEQKTIIMIVGGGLIILLGLFYTGVIKIKLFNQEKRFKMKTENMNPLTAYILGFTFSFGWTPCIGPMLASVLIMASASESVLSANILIVLYTLGFIMPFIITTLFYSKLLNTINKLKENMNAIKRIGGIILIISGIMMLSGGIKEVKYIQEKNSKTQQEQYNSNSKNEKQESDEVIPPDFTLYDQYGKEHTLSQYKGKTVFLNFWATWCSPCKQEMPHIEEIYKEYGLNKEEVVILGVAAPNLGREGNEEYIKTFLKDSEYTFPVVFDLSRDLMYQYGIDAFPSTFIIDKNGYAQKYIPGAMDKKTMKHVIDSTK